MANEMNENEQNINEQHVANLRDIFSIFDRDKNGKVTKETLKDVMMSLDVNPTDNDLNSFMKTMNKNNKRYFDFDDYVDINK